MKIHRIELCNFGSYAGKCEFDLNTGKKGNIVLIGGKNGAGKTTLFSGIKLCLYGNKSAGFENINAFYRKEVRKYINDVSKFDTASECYVKLYLSFSNGQKEDKYELLRQWDNNAESLENFEQYCVTKNGSLFSEEERADFDNYVINIIPPELFDLFFFDGEQIADYFLGENGNKRVKNAFMVLCGYDTFFLMQKNFKRLAFGRRGSSNDSLNYVKAKQIADKLKAECDNLANLITLKKEELADTNEEIKYLEKQYKLSGGVTYEEWNQKLSQIKEEEKLREDKNALLKKLANDNIPFIIVKSLLERLSEQIEKEHAKQQFEILKESLENLFPKVMERVYLKLDWKNNIELTDVVMEEFRRELEQRKVMDIKNIINIFGEEYLEVQRAIAKYLTIDEKLIVLTEEEIKESVQRTQVLRQQIETCSVDGIEKFLKNKSKLIEQANQFSAEIQEYLEKLQLKNQEYDQAMNVLKKEEKKFDEVSKNLSIIDLSEKSVAFLDVLQKRLYKNEIQRVEQLFMKKIKELARKSKFIDRINIDKDFNVHIYKEVTFNTKNVCKKIKEMGVQSYILEYGQVHCQGLISSVNVQNINEFVEIFKDKSEEITVLQEIEKSRLSKGEKQVFIMALYWSFMQLNKQQVPFIIDTPFARIDSEHRTIITENFFMDLSGQVFIFSTNEEITSEHYDRMKPNIQARFLLENTDTWKTTVYANKYFGG